MGGLHSHAGAARAAYNWAVAHATAVWWQRRAEQSYGIPEEELTPWRSWSLPALRKAFNEGKRTDPRFAGWWEEDSKEAYNTGLANASAAFDNYAKSKSGKRKGARVGIPRFKPKRKARLTCRFTTGSIRLEPDGRHVTLPRIGTVRLHDNRADLRALIDAGALRILSATRPAPYGRDGAGRWHNPQPPGRDRNGSPSTGHQGTTRALVTPSRTIPAETPGLLRSTDNQSNGVTRAKVVAPNRECRAVSVRWDSG